MKVRGFTLIELLAVIVILTIIALITVPLVLDTVDVSKNKLNENQKIAVENAAREWGIKNISVSDDNKAYYNGSQIKSITIKKLQDEHYLDGKDSLKNIKINDISKAGVCVRVLTNGDDFTGFSYVFKDDVTGSNC